MNNALTSMWTPIVIVVVSGFLPGGSTINIGLYAASLIFSVLLARYSVEVGWRRPRVGIVDPSYDPGNKVSPEAGRAWGSISWMPILWIIMAIRVSFKKPEQEHVFYFAAFAAVCVCVTGAFALVFWLRVWRTLARYQQAKCVECGYSLGGTPALDGRVCCPECGAENATLADVRSALVAPSMPVA